MYHTVTMQDALCSRIFIDRLLGFSLTRPTHIWPRMLISHEDDKMSLAVYCKRYSNMYDPCWKIFALIDKDEQFDANLNNLVDKHWMISAYNGCSCFRTVEFRRATKAWLSLCAIMPYSNCRRLIEGITCWASYEYSSGRCAICYSDKDITGHIHPELIHCGRPHCRDTLRAFNTSAIAWMSLSVDCDSLLSVLCADVRAQVGAKLVAVCLQEVEACFVKVDSVDP